MRIIVYNCAVTILYGGCVVLEKDFVSNFCGNSLVSSFFHRERLKTG